MHAIGAAEAIENIEPSLIEELQLLTESTDEGTRSKAIVALAKRRHLDANCFENAVKMLNSNTDHVVYAGLLALTTKESITPTEQRTVNRVFLKYLQSCNYEFVNLFATAYRRWIPDAKSYLSDLLAGDYPEYLDIALETLEAVQENSEE